MALEAAFARAAQNKAQDRTQHKRKATEAESDQVSLTFEWSSERESHRQEQVQAARTLLPVVSTGTSDSLCHQTAGPSGLLFARDFLSSREARDLWACVEAQPWQSLLKRRVQHYGWTYHYRERHVSEQDYLGPLPPWLDTVARELVRCGALAQYPDQVIVNEYLPGQGIGAHVDEPRVFGDAIATLSLGGSVPLVLSRVGASSDTHTLWVTARSLVVLTGEARYEWTHAIPARCSDSPPESHRRHVKRTRRISLTFRRVKNSRKVLKTCSSQP